MTGERTQASSQKSLGDETQSSNDGSAGVWRALTAVREAKQLCIRRDNLDIERLAEYAAEQYPDWAEPYFLMALARNQIGDNLNSMALLESCLHRDIEFEPAVLLLNRVCVNADRGELFRSLAEKYLAASPWNARVRFQLATSLLRSGFIEKAVEQFNTGLSSPVSSPTTRMLPKGILSLAKLKHDLMQLRHLTQIGVLKIDEYQTEMNIFAQLLNQFTAGETTGMQNSAMRVDEETLSLLNRVYRKVIHIDAQPRVEAGTLSDSIDAEVIAGELSKSSMGFVVVDNILSDNALRGIVRYMERSTIWHNDDQLGGTYIGAYRQNGLACPLIDQLAQDLQEKFTNILAGKELVEYWAYRLVLGEEGVGTHADSSRLNINIWLSPDSYEGDSGGMVIYRKKPPADWDFENYNGSPDLIDSETEGVEKHYIPFRKNRGVIFDPRYFHRSASIPATEDFCKLRTNLTFLFGEV